MRCACGVHAVCTWCVCKVRAVRTRGAREYACGVHAVCIHAVRRRRTGELGGEEVLRRRVEVELVDVVLREDGPLGAAVEPRLAARGLQLLREQVQQGRLARAVGPEDTDALAEGDGDPQLTQQRRALGQYAFSGGVAEARAVERGE
eukprot:scaffold93206_cov57-Phaeocystis_antarctica.AAC.5